MKKILLVGGGHSHLDILRDRLTMPAPDVALQMLTPEPRLIYSGMFPGLIAGHYSQDETRVPVARLARAAGVQFVEDRAIGIDADARAVLGASGARYDYDAVSFDVGSTALMAEEAAAENVIAFKPFSRFLGAWPKIIAGPHAPRVLIVGGGAAAVEMALAIQFAFARKFGRAATRARVAIVTNTQVVPLGQPAFAQQIFTRLLRARDIAVTFDRSVARVATGAVHLHGGDSLQADWILLATGAAPYRWLADSAMTKGAHGWIATGANLQSVSHPNVFATGDCGEIQGANFPKSGVYALREGETIAHNLLAFARGEALAAYQPQRHSLNIISTGTRHGVATRASFTLSGGWVWRWKDWVDRRFIAKYSI